MQQHQGATARRHPGRADAVQRALAAQPWQRPAGAGCGQGEQAQAQPHLEQAACADPVQQGIGRGGSQHIAQCIGGVEPAGLRVTPVQVLAHGRQQQRVGKAAEAVGHRHRQAQGEGGPQRGQRAAR
ncbi:hypothetical protein D3C73_1249030 [compost metagenome]